MSRTTLSRRLLLRAGAAGVQCLEAHEILTERYRFGALLLGRRQADLPPQQRSIREWLPGEIELWSRRFDGRLKTLARHSDGVGDWWVASRTPASEPRATSALEEVLWRGSALRAHIGVAASDHEVTGQFVFRHCWMDPASVTALRDALRVEIAGMIDAVTRGTLVRIPGADPRRSRYVQDCCEEDAGRHLPFGWAGWTPGRRAAYLIRRYPGPVFRAVTGPDRPCVELVPGPHKSVSARVLGEALAARSEGMVQLLGALLVAFPAGLSLQEVRESHPSGDRALRNLSRADSRWRAAIQLPGGRGKGGYRIRSWREAEE